MKKSMFLLLLCLSFSGYAQAGSATITTDAATDARLQNWCFVVGPGLGVTVAATKGAVTGPQVKQCIIASIQSSMFGVENGQATQAIVVTPVSQMN